MRNSTLLFFLGAFCPWQLPAADWTPASQSFRQEIARRFEAAAGRARAPVQLIQVSPEGIPRCFAGGRWYEWQNEAWRELANLVPARADQFVAPASRPGQTPITFPVPAEDVIQWLETGLGQFVVTTTDILRVVEQRVERLGAPVAGRLRQLAVSAAGEIVVASEAGLFRRRDQSWEPLRVSDSLGRAWAVEHVLGVAFDSGGQLWFATKAGVGCRTPAGWRFFEGRDGLPWNDFTGVAAGPDGEMWFGTRLGVIRWDGRDFHYRQGPGWLPDDHVTQIAVDAAGSAWIATPKGVGLIERRPMTLAAKAEYFEEEIQRHVKRTPYGYVSGAPLRRTGDKTSASPDDSDNDGLWTAMYGAGECFAFAATRDQKARERATQAFEALRFLQTVTQGGTPAPPKGYVARTIRPVEWPDPNVGRVAHDRERQKADALWKVYENRWPKSADGRWYWKSDTSSDELDGHYFFYPLYFDFVAESPEEKTRVRDVVRDLTDHLLTHGYTLTDHDGRPTRWGMYAPKALNGDSHWWAERGLNSLSLLSYLAVARHVTGDAKYERASRELIDQHGYAQNLMYPKAQFGPGSGNQSDDEMAFMSYYNLLRYSTDEPLKNEVRASWHGYWRNEAPEMNPFFNFAYAAHSAGRTTTNQWGVASVSPTGNWHEESMAMLYGLPLDRLNWARRNSHRLDVIPLGRSQGVDYFAASEKGRGLRVNGRVLPVENRHFAHWNTDPWTLDYGGHGNHLAPGTIFLLPYYLGLYHGYIAKP